MLDIRDFHLQSADDPAQNLVGLGRGEPVKLTSQVLYLLLGVPVLYPATNHCASPTSCINTTPRSRFFLSLRKKSKKGCPDPLSVTAAGKNSTPNSSLALPRLGGVGGKI